MSNKQTIEDKKADRKEYFRNIDKGRINLRMTTDEKTLLEIQMKEEGWVSKSAFIKYKLFGYEPEERVEKVVKEMDSESIGILLRNQVLKLTDSYLYFQYRYEKDMNQLYREIGVDADKWRDATNRWHSAMMRKLLELFRLIGKIARRLKLEDYFQVPSDYMDIDPETASQEELTALTKQIFKENLSLGLTDSID